MREIQCREGISDKNIIYISTLYNENKQKNSKTPSREHS